MLVHRPQDRMKVMVLVPSVIAVLLYFIFGVLPMMAKMRQASSPATTPVDTTTTNTTSTAPPPIAAPTVTSPLMASTDTVPDTMADPFKPPIAGPATGAEAATIAPTNKPVLANVGPAPIGGIQPAQLPLKTGGVVIGPAVGSATPTAPSQDLTLQGVVLSDHAVGVFRAGDQTFYKGIGEVVTDHMVLKLVADSGVVLARGKQLYTLEIGHSDLSPTKTMAPPANSTVARSAIELNKAAVAYHAQEAAATIAQPHAQEPAILQRSPARTVVSSLSRSAESTRTAVSNNLNDRVSGQPISDANKIVVSTANLVSDPNQISSVPADDLSPEIHQVSTKVQKRARVRHRGNRRAVRYGRSGHRHLARRGRHARPRSHE